jgi:hypothetical protein
MLAMLETEEARERERRCSLREDGRERRCMRLYGYGYSNSSSSSTGSGERQTWGEPEEVDAWSGKKYLWQELGEEALAGERRDIAGEWWW